MSAERSNIRDQSLRMICTALGSQQAVDFVHTAVRTGYAEYFRTAMERGDGMLDESFGKLALSQSGGAKGLVQHSVHSLHRGTEVFGIARPHRSMHKINSLLATERRTNHS